MSGNAIRAAIFQQVREHVADQRFEIGLRQCNRDLADHQLLLSASFEHKTQRSQLIDRIERGIDLATGDRQRLRHQQRL